MVRIKEQEPIAKFCLRKHLRKRDFYMDKGPIKKKIKIKIKIKTPTIEPSNTLYVDGHNSTGPYF